MSTMYQVNMFVNSILWYIPPPHWWIYHELKMPRSLTVSNGGLYHEQWILIERPVLNFQFFHQKSHQNSKEFPYELKFSTANIETNIDLGAEILKFQKVLKLSIYNVPFWHVDRTSGTQLDDINYVRIFFDALSFYEITRLNCIMIIKPKKCNKTDDSFLMCPYLVI